MTVSAADSQKQRGQTAEMYEAADISAEVEVNAYRKREDSGQGWNARRTVKLAFNQTFIDDTELDIALDAFIASIKAAVRRE